MEQNWGNNVCRYWFFSLFQIYCQRKSRGRKKSDSQGGIDIDNIGSLEDLPRIAFIREECGNTKGFVDGGELARNINKKNNLGALQAYRCPLCNKCFRRE